SSLLFVYLDEAFSFDHLLCNHFIVHILFSFDQLHVPPDGPTPDRTTCLLLSTRSPTSYVYFIDPSSTSLTFKDPSRNMDIGVSSHLNFDSSNLSAIFNSCLNSSVCGEDKTIPVTNTGHNILSTLDLPLHLHNVLVTHNIIKILIYVRQFTRNNNCTIEFDAFRFPVNDFLTRHILLKCDSSRDLYPVTKLASLPSALMSLSSSTWHQRLGHPSDELLHFLVSRNFISCKKDKSHYVCHACQLVSLYFPCLSAWQI
nr:ribonuclease H-like domain-containing protein [Tanacetum cinerariifolium]GEY00785.1 ribonuclease H-like domain-containing protein [Tanacetum cinerariifolium]